MEDDLSKAQSFKYAVALIRRAWQQIYHETMPIAGQSSQAQFQAAIVELKQKMASAASQKLWADYLDLPPEAVKQADISSSIIGIVEPDSRIKTVDDLSPNQFKRAVYAVALKKAKTGEIVKMALPAFLRLALRETLKANDLQGQLNVGPNRHFPRMFRWLQEVADETFWRDGQGLKIRNAGGHGPVAANPYDPKTLVVLLNREYLP